MVSSSDLKYKLMRYVTFNPLLCSRTYLLYFLYEIQLLMFYIQCGTLFSRHFSLYNLFIFLSIVKLQLPYELSFLSVFWITSKSYQTYMLDVVREVFSRSGRTKTRRREASWLSNSFILGKNISLYMVPEGLILQEVHKMTK